MLSLFVFIGEAMEQESGFSLIELLVVIMIVSILASITIPAMLAQRNRARQGEVMSAAHNLMVSVIANSTAFKGVYPLAIAYGDPAQSNQTTVYFTADDPFRKENVNAWYKPEGGRVGFNFCLESKHVPNQHVHYTHVTGSLSPWIQTQGCEAAMQVSGPGWVQLQ